MNVLITECNTGHIVATVPVILQSINFTPSEQEYFSEAWKCVLEDGLVEKNDRVKYCFEMTRPV